MFRSRRAFTLIEVLVVVAILGVLMSVAVGGGRWALRRAHVARAQAELSALSSALEGYKRQHGDYPRTAGGSGGGAAHGASAQLLQSFVGALVPSGAPLSPRGRIAIDLAVFTVGERRDPFTDPTAELVDPWGTAYVYRYKEPLGSWTNPSFVLYSAGPDGRHNPTLLTGGYPQRDLDENRDNLYATP